jgi:hypothetical protein
MVARLSDRAPRVWVKAGLKPGQMLARAVDDRGHVVLLEFSTHTMPWEGNG